MGKKGAFTAAQPQRCNRAKQQLQSHKMGHNLGLLHTFESSNGHEKVNGGNGATSAGLIAILMQTRLFLTEARGGAVFLKPGFQAVTGNNGIIQKII